MLASELKEMGVKDVDYDEEHCYLYAGIPGDPELPALGFISHMDTSPAVSGAGVKPRILENYDGKDSLLKPEEFPELAHHIGEDLIATDGTTLLGADDKAGVAEIMDGFEAARAIRKMKRPDAMSIPIIAMTADVFEEDIRKCREAGMNDHIAKPVEPEILYRTLIRNLVS